MESSRIEGTGKEEETQEEAGVKVYEKGEEKSHRVLIGEIRQEQNRIQLDVEQMRREVEELRQQSKALTDWAISQQRISLKPLIADLLFRFVKKATAVMNQTNHLLIPSSTRDNSFRVATPAEVAASIPESDKYALARTLSRGFWAESPERILLEPMFVFVYGFEFEEMESRDTESIFHELDDFGVAKVEQNPWSSRAVTRPWREPQQRSRRIGGRSGRGQRG
ncbi:MAG: hypothetical protein Q9208_006703 [Pyrenodesmia sp. 3 TL-2023]